MSMPTAPPSYADTQARDSVGSPVQQFDIDEPLTFGRLKPPTLLQRAVGATRNILNVLRNRVAAPLARAADPMVEGYRYFQMKYEHTILKIGNPLVVKRLLYVALVVAVMYGVSERENSDGVNGASGGAFSTGKFYDVPMLADTLRHYIDAATLKDNIEYMSLMPHMAGTLGDLALARYIESYFHNNGVQLVDIHELDGFLNYPTTRLYMRFANGDSAAKLHSGDGDATAMHNLAFCPNLPSTDGELFAPYVYANHGDAADFAALVAAHVTVDGAIVVMRYGGRTPEPNKVHMAALLGARAVVFVTDPLAWGGKTRDDVISGANVGLTRVCYGDVLTPGWSTHVAAFESMLWAQSPSTAKIPAIPILWRDGKLLVKRLGTKGVNFGDGMFSGEGANTKTNTDTNTDLWLRLRIEHEERTTHLHWNVVGGIRGREQASKAVIFGAARDSLAYGASGAASATATLLELVKVFTSLQRRFDWSPLRLMYFVSFDATEYNLGGAGEWVEEPKLLARDGYVYIDVGDVASGDTLAVLTNPLLLSVVRDELRNVPLEEHAGKTGAVRTLYDLYKEQHGSDTFSSNMVADRNYVPFVAALQMPALDVGFRGAAVPNGPHDTFANFDKEVGSSMLRHKQMVELLARVGLRLAEDPMLQFDVVAFADSLAAFQKDLEAYVREQLDVHGADAHLDYSRLSAAIKTFRERFVDMDQFRIHWKEFIKSTSSLEPAMLASSRKGMNVNMMEFSHQFARAPNKSLRVGYRNALFGAAYNAPPFDDGVHEWNTFPFVRDLVAQGHFDEAQSQIDDLANRLVIASEFSMVP